MFFRYKCIHWHTSENDEIERIFPCNELFCITYLLKGQVSQNHAEMAKIHSLSDKYVTSM